METGDVELKPGVRVQLVGLEARAEMNGMWGVLVQEAKDKQGRWEVLIDGESKRRVLKCGNLFPMENDAARVTRLLVAREAKPDSLEEQTTTTSEVSTPPDQNKNGETDLSRQRFKKFSERIAEKVSAIAPKEDSAHLDDKLKSFTKRVAEQTAVRSYREDEAREKGSSGLLTRSVFEPESKDVVTMRQLPSEDVDDFVLNDALHESETNESLKERLRSLEEVVARQTNGLQSLEEKVAKQTNELQSLQNKVAKQNNEVQNLEDKVVTQSNELQTMMEEEVASYIATKHSRLAEQVETAMEAAELAAERQASLSDMLEYLDKTLNDKLDGLEDKFTGFQEESLKSSMLGEIRSAKSLDDDGECSGLNMRALFAVEESVTMRMNELADRLRCVEETVSKIGNRHHFAIGETQPSNSRLVTSQMSELAMKLEILEDGLARSGALQPAQTLMAATLHRRHFQAVCASSNWCPSVDLASILDEPQVWTNLMACGSTQDMLIMSVVSTIRGGARKNALNRAVTEKASHFLQTSQDLHGWAALPITAIPWGLIALIDEHSDGTGALLADVLKLKHEVATALLIRCGKCETTEEARDLEAELQEAQRLRILLSDGIADAKGKLRAVKDRLQTADRKLRSAVSWATKKDAPKLELAIKIAREAGVDSKEIAKAESALRLLQPSLCNSVVTKPVRRSSVPPRKNGAPMSLYGFLQKAVPEWPPSSLAGAVEKLEKISIHTVNDLKGAIFADGDLHLTNRLRDANLKVFKIETLQSIEALCID